VPRASALLAGIALLIGAGAAPATAGAPTASLAAKRSQAVKWAVSQAGHTETGNSNCSTRINRWERDMGFKVPPCRVWCGAFVHQAFLQAGIRLSARLIDPDRSYGDALAGRRGLRAIPIKSVRRGDILFYKIRPNLRASHLAIVRDSPRNGAVHTAEGNTSNAVRLNTRRLDVPVLAARVTGSA
jgi:hypothetical protein